MKKLIFSVLCAALLFTVFGCIYTGFGHEYKLDMYISLSLFGAYPAEHPVNTIDDLAEFGGKNVFFSVKGIDSDFNDSINIQKVSQFAWTGGTSDSSTQYAVTTIDLTENTMYLAGRYKFMMFIDWDGSSSLSSGDLVFNSYSLLADKDDDVSTAALQVAESEYGTSVVYSPSDYSIIIEDPLSTDSGLPWIITSIHEGELAVYP